MKRIMLWPVMAAALLVPFALPAQIGVILNDMDWMDYNVLDDTTDLPYPTPEWSPSSSSPVVAVAGSPIAVCLECNVYVVTPGPVWIYGLCYNPLMTFGSSNFVENTAVCGFCLTSSNSLRSGLARTVNPLQISWWYYATNNPNWAPLGTTTNLMYVTLGNPQPDPDTGRFPTYRTVMQTACEMNRIGRDNVVAAIWQHFAGPANITTWDGRALYYYQTNTTCSQCVTDLQHLLVQTNGNCHAFQNFLEDCLLVHGLWTESGVWTNYQYVTVYASRANSPEDVNFLVNNWGTNNAGTSGNTNYPWQIFTTLNPPYYFEMVPVPYPPDGYGDLTSLTGVAGQNSATPSEKVFYNHQFLVYYTTAGGKIYYDPSYGITYSSTAPAPDMEQSAIFGFSTDLYPPSPTNNFCPVYVRKPTATDGSDLLFVEWSY